MAAVGESRPWSIHAQPKEKGSLETEDEPLAWVFPLKDTHGAEWYLQDLQGRPVVFLIGSGICPVA